MLSARKSQYHYRTQDGITWLWIKSSNDLTSILVTYSETQDTGNNTPAILLFLEHSILLIYHWTTEKLQFLEPPSQTSWKPKVFVLSLLEHCISNSPISFPLEDRKIGIPLYVHLLYFRLSHNDSSFVFPSFLFLYKLWVNTCIMFENNTAGQRNWNSVI